MKKGKIICLMIEIPKEEIESAKEFYLKKRAENPNSECQEIIIKIAGVEKELKLEDFNIN